MFFYVINKNLNWELKKQYIGGGGLPKKRGLGQFADLRGKTGSVFEGGLTP